MAATPSQVSLETSLTRLNDGRALLFTEARTANTFSDPPVTSEQFREIYELMKWGPTWSNTLPLRIVYVPNPLARPVPGPFLAPSERIAERLPARATPQDKHCRPRLPPAAQAGPPCAAAASAGSAPLRGAGSAPASCPSLSP